MLAIGGACGDGEADRDEAPTSRACTVLTRDEVESFVGEAVHAGTPDALQTDTCRWGDADPAPPGHVLSVRLGPADAPPGEGDQVYDLPDLGGTGIQQAGGGVRVVFTVEDQWAELTYDVVPVDALESDAIDRLARLAGRVRDRLAALR